MNIELKIGSKFLDNKGNKHTVVNIFEDKGQIIVVYKYWRKFSPRWIYDAEYLDLLLIGFDYGWKLI